MVKRIKKRIPKKEAPVEEVEQAEAPAEGDGLHAELAAVADDEFTEKTAKMFQWLIDNKTPVLVGIGALALVIGVTVFVQRSREAAREAASSAFDEAAVTYAKANEVTPPAKPGEAPKVRPAAERKADLEKARGLFEATRSQHAEQPIARLSALGAAGAALDLGDVDGALKLYDEALAATELDTFGRAIALQGKAAALETKGDKKAALEAWKAFVNLDERTFGLVGSVEIGRLLEALGQKKEARAHYEKLQKDHEAALGEMSNRAVKAEVEKRLARLTEA